jgi:hypothetical protein
MYISVNRHFINSNNCFAIYLRFAWERVKRYFPISNVSAGNKTLCREQHMNYWLFRPALQNNPTVRRDEPVLTNSVSQPIRDALHVASDRKGEEISIFSLFTCWRQRIRLQSRSENLKMYLTVSLEHNLLLQNNLKLNRNTKLQTNVENYVPFRHNKARLRGTHGEHSHQVWNVVGQFFEQSLTANNGWPFVWAAVRSHKTFHCQNLLPAVVGPPFRTFTNINLLFWLCNIYFQSVCLLLSTPRIYTLPHVLQQSCCIVNFTTTGSYLYNTRIPAGFLSRQSNLHKFITSNVN